MGVKSQEGKFFVANLGSFHRGLCAFLPQVTKPAALPGKAGTDAGVGVCGKSLVTLDTWAAGSGPLVLLPLDCSMMDSKAKMGAK